MLFIVYNGTPKYFFNKKRYVQCFCIWKSFIFIFIFIYLFIYLFISLYSFGLLSNELDPLSEIKGMLKSKEKLI